MLNDPIAIFLNGARKSHFVQKECNTGAKTLKCQATRPQERHIYASMSGHNGACRKDTKNDNVG